MRHPLTKNILPVLLLVAGLVPGSPVAGAVYNLAADWSNVQNPFGVWQLWKAPGVLFTTNLIWDGSGQRAWADAPFPEDDHVPVWMKYTGPGDGGNLAPGDILAHGAELDRTGTNLTSVVWTSPVAGTAVISGGVWPISSAGRTMTWQFLRNGVLLSEGTLVTDGTVTYTRQAPFSFATGSGGALALTQPVAVGDQLELRFRSDSGGGNLGDFLDVDLQVTTTPADTDSDGVLDASDNCPTTTNPDQADNDLDALGDVCDGDDDNDGVGDPADNCPFSANPDQADADGDSQGNVCDGDLDGDGVANEVDNCPLNPNSDQSDTDGDSAGDACDPDDDNDAVGDGSDNCPSNANPGQADLDGDNIGDACDADLDGDGVANEVDNCRLVSNLGQDDTDGDGVGDACDPDDDNDGVGDGGDNCPLIVNPDQTDSDGDGQGNACDGDLDGDGVSNAMDNCPTSANSAQNDFDGDGAGDVCDADLDDDGVGNAPDLCAFTPRGEVVDPATDCSIAQLVPCTGPLGTTEAWKNHGQYVSRVAKTAESFVALGLITEAQKDAIVSAAAQSNCGQ